MDPIFWRDKKVLITGHTGFKGSWLALWLQKLRATTVGFSTESPTAPNLFSIAHVAKNMTSIIGDIRDFNLLKKVIEEHQPDIIFHLAAQALVPYSYVNPIETYSTNVMGTVHLLEAARQVGSCRAIVNVTSDKCYENKEHLRGYHEQDRLGGHDPYSNSKACAELVTSAFRNSYYKTLQTSSPCGIASARAGNVIGGGDWAEHRLVPDIMRNFLFSENFVVRYPQAIRPWQHVLEPLCGYLQLAEYLYQKPEEHAEAWNFGPNEDDAKSVSWVIDKLYQLWGCSAPWSCSQKNQPHETVHLKLDSTKARQRLRWTPRWTLEKTLRMTADWFRAYQAGNDMRQYTLNQLNEYADKQDHL